MKKIFALLLATACAFSFAACKKDSCQHVDKNDDGKCDVCSAEFSDGDEVKPTPTVQCAFTVQTDKGVPVAAAVFELSAGNDTYTLTANDNGVASAEIKVGTYSISYDFDTLPEAHFPDIFEVSITESTTAITLPVMDNTPDGSAEKPFYVADSVTDITLEAGAQVYYVYRSAGIKTLEIPNENVTVEYNGATYTAENGKVSFVIESKMGMSMVTLCIKNTSAAAISTQMSILSALGTAIDNPILLTENTATANIPKDGIVYYKWVPAQSGIMVVSSDNIENDINIQNLTSGAYSNNTSGSSCEYMTVDANDEVIICVATLPTDAEITEITFSIEFYLGTDEQPLPILKNNVSLSLKPNQSIVCSASAGKTITITNPNARIEHDTITYTPNAENIISVGLFKDLFAVTNTAEVSNTITVKMN